MSFEQAKLISSIAHYSISIFILIFGMLYRHGGFINIIFRFYGLVIVWACICIIFNGCPLTRLENWASYNIYKIPFYPDYSFNSTDIKWLLIRSQFYYPLALALIALGIKYKYERSKNVIE